MVGDAYPAAIKAPACHCEGFASDCHCERLEGEKQSLSYTLRLLQAIAFAMTVTWLQ
jgi:hypothetical protein